MTGLKEAPGVLAEIHFFCLDAGDRGKGLWISDCGHRQEEIPGSLGHNRGSVHVDHQEADPVALREGHISLCRQDCPPI